MLVQPLASVMVQVYVPGASPVAVAPVCTGVVFHEYVYGPELPFTVSAILPSGVLPQ